MLKLNGQPFCVVKCIYSDLQRWRDGRQPWRGAALRRWPQGPRHSSGSGCTHTGTNCTTHCTNCLHWETLLAEIRKRLEASLPNTLTTCVESWWAERRGPAETAATGPPADRPPIPSRLWRGSRCSQSPGSGRTGCPCHGSSPHVSLGSDKRRKTENGNEREISAGRGVDVV